MPYYVVDVEGTFVESYLVEADSAQDAEYWWNGTLLSSQSVDAEIVSINRVED